VLPSRRLYSPARHLTPSRFLLYLGCRCLMLLPFQHFSLPRASYLSRFAKPFEPPLTIPRPGVRMLSFVGSLLLLARHPMCGVLSN